MAYGRRTVPRRAVKVKAKRRRGKSRFWTHDPGIHGAPGSRPPTSRYI